MATNQQNNKLDSDRSHDLNLSVRALDLILRAVCEKNIFLLNSSLSLLKIMHGSGWAKEVS